MVSKPLSQYTEYRDIFSRYLSQMKFWLAQWRAPHAVSRKDGVTVDCRVPIFSYDHGKWIYIRRPYNWNIEIERNGMKRYD